MFGRGRVELGLEGNCSPVAIIGNGGYAEMQKPFDMLPALLSAAVNDSTFPTRSRRPGLFCGRSTRRVEGN